MRYFIASSLLLLAVSLHFAGIQALPAWQFRTSANASSITTQPTWNNLYHWNFPTTDAARCDGTNYAWVRVLNDENSDFLQLTGFNFDIPADYPVTAVSISVQRTAVGNLVNSSGMGVVVLGQAWIHINRSDTWAGDNMTTHNFDLNLSYFATAPLNGSVVSRPNFGVTLGVYGASYARVFCVGVNITYQTPVITSGLITTAALTTGTIGTTETISSTGEVASSSSDQPYGYNRQAAIIGTSVSIGGALLVFIGVLIFRRRQKQVHLRDLDVELQQAEIDRALRSSNRSVSESEFSFTPDSISKGSRALFHRTLEYLKDIKVIHRLGGGQFGEVYLGEWQGATKVALKLLKDDAWNDFLREAEITASLNHPNVIRCLGLYCSPEDERYIVMEYLREGSLDIVLRREKDKLAVGDLTGMAIQAAAGMLYLEERSILHRDLSLRNFMVGKEGAGYVIKVGDFGMSRNATDGAYESSTSLFPVKWTAVESLFSGQFTSQSDVWSFGVVLWELFSYGDIPYPGMSNREVADEVKRGYRMEAPPNCPDEIYRLMLECWRVRPEDRPTFRAIHKRLCELATEETAESPYTNFVPTGATHYELSPKLSQPNVRDSLTQETNYSQMNYKISVDDPPPESDTEKSEKSAKSKESKEDNSKEDAYGVILPRRSSSDSSSSSKSQL